MNRIILTVGLGLLAPLPTCSLFFSQVPTPLVSFQAARTVLNINHVSCVPSDGKDDFDYSCQQDPGEVDLKGQESSRQYNSALLFLRASSAHARRAASRRLAGVGYVSEEAQ